MGVKGLWELLHPVARPIKLENLSNKYLAVDASIWLHQFLRGMRDKEGQVISNAHIIGFFRRICKLLYFNVKPIFVFDGGTPALKRLTIQERRKRKRHDANMVKKTAEKLLAAQLRLHALEQRKAARKKKAEEKQRKIEGVVHDSDENPKYLNDIESDLPPETSAQVDMKELGAVVGSQAKRIKDKYVLPPMEVDFEDLAKLRNNDERLGYQEQDEVEDFLSGFKKDGNLNNIDSDVFKALPSEVQYEVLQDIRLRSRLTSYERVQEMVRLSDTPMDFSQLQVQGVIKRNTVTQKLLTVNQRVSKVETAVKPGRIASQRNRQYILVKNDDGGWVLGGKKPTTGHSADKPVQLDSDEDLDIKEEIKDEDEDGSDWESDDDVELEEVKIPQTINPAVLTNDLSGQSIPPATELKPNADDSNLLINHLEAYVDEDESIEKVMAKFAEIEDEASRKRSARELLVHSDIRPEEVDTTNQKNGLHLIRESDVIQIQDGARMHLTKASLRLKNDPQWSEVKSDEEELGSLDTLYSMDTIPSDNTVDYDNFEDMVEDENTGEIISRSTYNKRYQRQCSPETLNKRALTTSEESNLNKGAFQRYWAGYTPDYFKVKNPEYEDMLEEAIYNWDDEKLAAEIRSTTRKHEKSNVNDTLGVETLMFWKSFLESLVLRRHHIQTSRASMQAIEIEESEPMNLTNSKKLEGKSRLSQLISLDDDEEVEGNDDGDVVMFTEGLGLFHQQKDSPVDMQIKESVTTYSPAPAQDNSEIIPSDTATAIRYPALDFSSSILKRQPPIDVEGITVPISSIPSDLDQSYEQLGLSDVSTMPDSIQGDVDIELLVDVSARDSGVDSVDSSPRPGSETAVVPTFDKSIDHSEDDEDEQSTVPMEDVTGTPLDEDMDTTQKEQDDVEVANEEDGNDDKEEEEEEEEEEEDEEAHRVDFENEEQDFSALFPNMINLPGAILKPKDSEEEEGEGPAIQEEKPVLSAEEKEILEKQDARKMLEESRQLESEIKTLKDQHRKHQRDADDLTESMVSETQMLLRLFGIPYLVAPMEAEAQCADLQIRGVVDGILTEDSDVFLFGGARVFKNMFKEEKFVECYLMSDIERDLGVGRDRLVALAYLLGSDYTTGIKGIGLITAMEIIRLFPKLENFARWWKGEQQSSGDGDDDKSKSTSVGLTEMELDSIDEVALEKLARQCRKIHIPSTFPDPHIGEAYTTPMVDDDPTKFQWGIPDLDGLRDFLRKSLGWDRREVDHALLPIIRQMSSAQTQAQSTLDGFFDVSAGMGSFTPLNNSSMFKSARLRKVVDGLKGQNSSTTGEVDDAESTENKAAKKSKPATKRAGTKRKPTAKKGKQQAASEGVDVGAEDSLDGIVILDDDFEDDEEGILDDQEQKKRKISQTASQKKTRTAQTKVPDAVLAAKSHLKSKDIQVKLAERKRNIAANASSTAGNVIGQTEPAKTSKRVKSDSTHNNSSDSDDSDRDDFASSHWDLLDEKQSQIEHQSPRKGSQAPLSTTSGRESVLTAMVSASNAARYGSGSFRDKATKSPKKAVSKATAGRDPKKARVSK
ncbi:DNA repair protein rad2 [Entomortierella beljakovae]|nr:DNA repair protein rad2 [Entomortierella beljakovae]